MSGIMPTSKEVKMGTFTRRSTAGRAKDALGVDRQVRFPILRDKLLERLQRHHMITQKGHIIALVRR